MKWLPITLQGLLLSPAITTGAAGAATLAAATADGRPSGAAQVELKRSIKSIEPVREGADNSPIKTDGEGALKYTVIHDYMEIKPNVVEVDTYMKSSKSSKSASSKSSKISHVTSSKSSKSKSSKGSSSKSSKGSRSQSNNPNDHRRSVSYMNHLGRFNHPLLIHFSRITNNVMFIVLILLFSPQINPLIISTQPTSQPTSEPSPQPSPQPSPAPIATTQPTVTTEQPTAANGATGTRGGIMVKCVSSVLLTAASSMFLFGV